MAYTTAVAASRRMCATCQYWHGARQVRFCSVTDVRVLYNGGSAECAAFNDQKRPSAFLCPRYRRWLELP